MFSISPDSYLYVYQYDVITRLMCHKDQAQLIDRCIYWSYTPTNFGQLEHRQYISEGIPNCSMCRTGNIYPSIPRNQHHRLWVRLRIGLASRSAVRRRRWEVLVVVLKRWLSLIWINIKIIEMEINKQFYNRSHKRR